MDEEVDQEENTAASLFQVNRGGKGVAKGRGKGKGKSKGKGKAAKASVSPKRRIVGKVSVAGAALTASAVQGATSSASSGGGDVAHDDVDRHSSVTAAASRVGSASALGVPKSLEEKMSKYRSQLEPLTVMSGTLENSGRVLWQASQTLTSLRKKDPTSHTCLTLHALVEEAKEAQKLCRGKLETLSTS
eukprot:6459011-Amphidinium_carterae.1